MVVMLRRWCVAWDMGMFGVSVDSRHLTPVDAYVWKVVGSCGYPGYYVTTIKKARAADRARQDAERRWQETIQLINQRIAERAAQGARPT